MEYNKKLGIQTKILSILLPVVIIIISIILFLVYSNTSYLILSKSEELLDSSTDSIVNKVESWITETLTALELEKDTIEYFHMSPDEELEYIKHTAGKYDSFPSGIYIGTPDGKLIHSSFVPDANYNLLEKSWYKEGLSYDKFKLTSVYLDSDTGSYVVGVSSKINDKDGNLKGVASADIYLDRISDIVKQVSLEKSGGVFLVDGKTNTIIGHKDSSVVGAVLDSQSGIYKKVSELIRDNKFGIQMYSDAESDDIYLDIKQVPDSEWIAVSYVPRIEIIDELNSLTRNIIFIAIISILILSLIMIVIVRNVIVKPIHNIDKVAKKIAEGELNQNIVINSHDELGTLAFNFNKTVSRLKDYVKYIDEISEILEQIADGKLDFSLQYDYVGEFAKVKKSFEYISNSLNYTLGEINQSADQVATGSDQVSGAAQSLSQSTTEQAGSIEQLAKSIDEISNQVQENAQNAKQASQKADEVERKIVESNKHMNKMAEAMDEIKSNSSEIGKIIKTIEDIAFQTNILALNAAVEAARAGEAGKGFAVVADEVRNLANKSAEASKNTAVLIENAVSSVDAGTKIADETKVMLDETVNATKEASSVIESITNATIQQSKSISQVMQGMDQISSVVQTNSATAEESAAASEELSGQAQTLKSLVGRFKTKEVDNDYYMSQIKNNSKF